MKKQDVLNHFGGTGKTAKALGVLHSAVSQWGEEMPMLRACQVQVVTNGALKADLNQKSKGAMS